MSQSLLLFARHWQEEIGVCGVRTNALSLPVKPGNDIVDPLEFTEVLWPYHRVFMRPRKSSDVTSCSYQKRHHDHAGALGHTHSVTPSGSLVV